MQTITGVSLRSAVGCEELGRMGLVDTSECCEQCHHAERYAPGLVAGPCRTMLPDGKTAFVCCTSKKRLLRRGS